jgi:uncharacterized Fe-S cluster protein YjdI
MTNPGRLSNWLGVEAARLPQMIPDRRDTYPGEQATIHDNRGLCAHAGLYTDRLATVFQLDAEPFVAPSGGRMDEIIRAVRACPSGALSLSLGGTEARDRFDRDRGTGDRGVARRPLPVATCSEVAAGGAVHVIGDVALVAVSRGRRPGGLEHQDRATRRRRLVLYPLGHDERVALTQHDGPLAASAIAQGDVELAVEHEEELVGVVMNVPHVLALGVRDADVVVVDPGHDPRAVDLVEPA